MRSHNERQLHSIFHFLWFDQQSFKIKAGWKRKQLVSPIRVLYAVLHVSYRQLNIFNRPLTWGCYIFCIFHVCDNKSKWLPFWQYNRDKNNASLLECISRYYLKCFPVILTVFTVVLLWWWGESQDLPINFRHHLRVFQSNPDQFLLRISGWEET